MKNRGLLILATGLMLFASCTKQSEEFAPKTDPMEVEEKISISPVTPIPWPRTSLKRVQVFLQGAQMVPVIRTSTKGSLVLNLYNNKYAGYKLTLTNLEPGDFPTGAWLYQGEPGTNGSPVFPLFFAPGENGLNKSVLLTDDQFNTLTYLLTPPVLPLIPNCYFVVSTYNHPSGLIRGKVIL